MQKFFDGPVILKRNEDIFKKVTTFFSETLFWKLHNGLCVMKIKYFEFYCKFHYFYEHLELQMILSTKYLYNLRPFTKQVKIIKKKQWKKCEADV